MLSIRSTSFEEVMGLIRLALIQAPEVNVGEWQAQRGGPQTLTVEVEDVSFEMDISLFQDDLAQQVKPNLPWAEDHFLERVSGIPYNPPPSEAWWPFRHHDNQEHKQDHIFSHTYPERMWPRSAGRFNTENALGIRYAYGDLNDVVRLLQERPFTRQAYLPIWFPEDTGSNEQVRVPCTLGYHFLRRDNQLKIVYYIRSCDFLRHFRDDVYLAARLCQWVADKIDALPGRLVMHISSMHVFAAERGFLRTIQQRRQAEVDAAS